MQTIALARRASIEEYRTPWERQVRFDVFNADRSFAGRARVPDVERLLDDGPGFVLTRRVDELGVHYNRLYERPPVD